MAANTSPIFIKQPNQGFDKLVTGNTSRDLSSGTTYTIFTADATNGSRLDHIKLQPLGTNVATVVRIFLNNGGAITTGTNNVLLDEVTMALTTASEVAELLSTVVPMDLLMKPGYRIVVTIGTSVSAGIAASAHGGDY